MTLVIILLNFSVNVYVKIIFLIKMKCQALIANFFQKFLVRILP